MVPGGSGGGIPGSCGRAGFAFLLLGRGLAIRLAQRAPRRPLRCVPRRALPVNEWTSISRIPRSRLGVSNSSVDLATGVSLPQDLMRFIAMDRTCLPREPAQTNDEAGDDKSPEHEHRQNQHKAALTLAP